jgi:hypothetical protein
VGSVWGEIGMCVGVNGVWGVRVGRTRGESGEGRARGERGEGRGRKRETVPLTSTI